MAGRAGEDWGCSKENNVAIVLELNSSHGARRFPPETGRAIHTNSYQEPSSSERPHRHSRGSFLAGTISSH